MAVLQKADECNAAEEIEQKQSGDDDGERHAAVHEVVEVVKLPGEGDVEDVPVYGIECK